MTPQQFLVQDDRESSVADDPQEGPCGTPWSRRPRAVALLHVPSGTAARLSTPMAASPTPGHNPPAVHACAAHQSWPSHGPASPPWRDGPSLDEDFSPLIVTLPRASCLSTINATLPIFDVVHRNSPVFPSTPSSGIKSSLGRSCLLFFVGESGVHRPSFDRQPNRHVRGRCIRCSQHGKERGDLSRDFVGSSRVAESPVSTSTRT